MQLPLERQHAAVPQDSTGRRVLQNMGRGGSTRRRSLLLLLLVLLLSLLLSLGLMPPPLAERALFSIS